MDYRTLINHSYFIVNGNFTGKIDIISLITERILWRRRSIYISATVSNPIPFLTDEFGGDFLLETQHVRRFRLSRGRS